MRQRRLKIPEDRPVGFYHCLSRVVDRRFIFGVPEKEDLPDRLPEAMKSLPNGNSAGL